MGVSAQAATTRTVLLGLGKAAGILLAFYAATGRSTGSPGPPTTPSRPLTS